MSVWTKRSDWVFFSLRSHLIRYQLGSNLVDQWKLWQCTDLFFSDIDEAVLQDPQLRLRVWLTDGCEISKGDKGEKSKKAKNHSPLCCNSKCNQLRTIIPSLDTQINLSWVHRKRFLYISARCLTWGLNQKICLQKSCKYQILARQSKFCPWLI